MFIILYTSKNPHVFGTWRTLPIRVYTVYSYSIVRVSTEDVHRTNCDQCYPRQILLLTLLEEHPEDVFINKLTQRMLQTLKTRYLLQQSKSFY